MNDMRFLRALPLLLLLSCMSYHVGAFLRGPTSANRELEGELLQNFGDGYWNFTWDQDSAGQTYDTNSIKCIQTVIADDLSRLVAEVLHDELENFPRKFARVQKVVYSEPAVRNITLFIYEDGSRKFFEWENGYFTKLDFGLESTEQMSEAGEGPSSGSNEPPKTETAEPSEQLSEQKKESPGNSTEKTEQAEPSEETSEAEEEPAEGSDEPSEETSEAEEESAEGSGEPPETKSNEPPEATNENESEEGFLGTSGGAGTGTSSWGTAGGGMALGGWGRERREMLEDRNGEPDIDGDTNKIEADGNHGRDLGKRKKKRTRRRNWVDGVSAQTCNSCNDDDSDHGRRTSVERSMLDNDFLKALNWSAVSEELSRMVKSKCGIKLEGERLAFLG